MTLNEQSSILFFVHWLLLWYHSHPLHHPSFRSVSSWHVGWMSQEIGADSGSAFGLRPKLTFRPYCYQTGDIISRLGDKTAAPFSKTLFESLSDSDRVEDG